MKRDIRWIATRNNALKHMGMSLSEFETEAQIVMAAPQPAVWIAYAMKHQIDTSPASPEHAAIPYFTRLKLACMVFMLSITCSSKEEFEAEIDRAIREGKEDESGEKVQ